MSYNSLKPRAHDWTQPAQEFIELFLFYYEPEYYNLLAEDS
jgi:hypothetical protein